jgi:hypothetical protein
MSPNPKPTKTMNTLADKFSEITTKKVPLNQEKTGFSEIPKGERVFISWEGTKAQVHIPRFQRTFKISNARVADMLGLNVPEFDELEEMGMDGDCESVLGNSVEPDGYDEYGAPSWLLAFGLI